MLGSLNSLHEEFKVLGILGLFFFLFLNIRILIFGSSNFLYKEFKDLGILEFFVAFQP